jgi:hypothetical protein
VHATHTPLCPLLCPEIYNRQRHRQLSLEARKVWWWGCPLTAAQPEDGDFTEHCIGNLERNLPRLGHYCIWYDKIRYSYSSIKIREEKKGIMLFCTCRRRVGYWLWLGFTLTIWIHARALIRAHVMSLFNRGLPLDLCLASTCIVTNNKQYPILLLDHPIMEYVVQKSARDRRLLFMTH